MASLRATGRHAGNSKNTVRRLWFVSPKARCPPHRRGIHAHRRLTDKVRIPRHARKAVAAFAKSHPVALRLYIDDSCSLRNVIWSYGHNMLRTLVLGRDGEGHDATSTRLFTGGDPCCTFLPRPFGHHAREMYLNSALIYEGTTVFRAVILKSLDDLKIPALLNLGVDQSTRKNPDKNSKRIASIAPPIIPVIQSP